jgi:hypothetical protein
MFPQPRYCPPTKLDADFVTLPNPEERAVPTRSVAGEVRIEASCGGVVGRSMHKNATTIESTQAAKLEKSKSQAAGLALFEFEMPFFLFMNALCANTLTSLLARYKIGSDPFQSTSAPAHLVRRTSSIGGTISSSPELMPAFGTFERNDAIIGYYLVQQKRLKKWYSLMVNLMASVLFKPSHQTKSKFLFVWILDASRQKARL